MKTTLRGLFTIFGIIFFLAYLGWVAVSIWGLIGDETSTSTIVFLSLILVISVIVFFGTILMASYLLGSMMEDTDELLLIREQRCEEELEKWGE